jgi:hypothetical protein
MNRLKHKPNLLFLIAVRRPELYLNLLVIKKLCQPVYHKKLIRALTEFTSYYNSIIMQDTQEWRLNGKLHRDDGPAHMREDGATIWYRNGKKHRDDGPAITTSSGTTIWYQNNKKHRTGGPAVTKPDGSTEWWENDEIKVPK